MAFFVNQYGVLLLFIREIAEGNSEVNACVVTRTTIFRQKYPFPIFKVLLLSTKEAHKTNNSNTIYYFSDAYRQTSNFYVVFVTFTSISLFKPMGLT